MTHRILLATLLAAINLATCAAQETNPALQARAAAQAAAKKLEWQIAVAAYSFRQFTFFETVDQVAELGVDLIEGFSFQKISKEMAGTLDPLKMSDEDLEKVRHKLQASGVSLIALYYGGFPADEAACRKIFENSKKLGVKYFVSEPKPDRLPMLDKLGREYGIIVGLHGHSKKSSPDTWHPATGRQTCQPFSPAIGAFSDTGHWLRSELDPAEGVESLKDRAVGFEVHDLHALTPRATTSRSEPASASWKTCSKRLRQGQERPGFAQRRIHLQSGQSRGRRETVHSVFGSPGDSAGRFVLLAVSPCVPAVIFLAAADRQHLRSNICRCRDAHVGAASCNITPESPSFLSGSFPLACQRS